MKCLLLLFISCLVSTMEAGTAELGQILQAYQGEFDKDRERILSYRSLSPSQKQRQILDAYMAYQVRHVNDLEASKDWQRFDEALQSLLKQWNGQPSDPYVQMFARATKLFAQSADESLRAKSISYGEQLASHLHLASPIAADEALLVLAGKYLPQLGKVAPFDLMKRDMGLTTYMDLIQRLEEKMSEPPLEIDQNHMFKPPAGGFIFLSEQRTPEQEAKMQQAIAEHHRHQDAYQVFDDDRRIASHFNRPLDGRKPKLEKEMAGFIQKRYSMSTDDLIELQQLFEKHIRSPELRQRLILATFNGTNPFLGLPGQVQASKRSSWLEQFRAQKAREQTAQAGGNSASGSAQADPTGGQAGVASKTGYLLLISTTTVLLAVLLWPLLRRRPGQSK